MPEIGSLMSHNYTSIFFVLSPLMEHALPPRLVKCVFLPLSTLKMLLLHQAISQNAMGSCEKNCPIGLKTENTVKCFCEISGILKLVKAVSAPVAEVYHQSSRVYRNIELWQFVLNIFARDSALVWKRPFATWIPIHMFVLVIYL